MVAVKNGGGVLGCKQNWGGVGIWWPKAANFVHRPLRMILTASLSALLLDLIFFGGGMGGLFVYGFGGGL